MTDLTNGYIIAEKGGVQWDVRIHYRFIYDESVFRFVMRVDGQPILASPITPFKGTATHGISWFWLIGHSSITCSGPSGPGLLIMPFLFSGHGCRCGILSG